MSRSSTLPHGTAWTIAILVVPVLYVGSWPFIENHYTWDPPQVPAINPDGYTIDLNLTPRWVDTLYAPLHWLRDANVTPNPFDQYWGWCLRQRGIVQMYK
jgi:hypothetical protein